MNSPDFRHYQECGDMMEVRIRQASIVEAVPLGLTEKEMPGQGDHGDLTP
jgi:hypothetical protein